MKQKTANALTYTKRSFGLSRLVPACLSMLMSAPSAVHALSAEAAAPTTAMISDPCLPPIPLPEVLAHTLQGALNPGPPASFSQLSSNPDVQAYFKAAEERARNDWPNLCKYRGATAALTTPPRVVFIGDSITENWVTGDPKLFTDGVIGRGISGQTSP